MNKAVEAFRTISEVALELDVHKHVLRFWEGKFPHIKPMKRGGGRRYYRPEDMELLRGIRHLLHAEGYTIKGVQKILREQGVDAVKSFGGQTPAPTAKAAARPDQRIARRKSKVTSRVTADDAIAMSGAVNPVQTIRMAIAAAIAELQACKQMILDDTLASAARRGGQRVRSSRSGY